jgi:hypothetical protein
VIWLWEFRSSQSWAYFVKGFTGSGTCIDRSNVIQPMVLKQIIYQWGGSVVVYYNQYSSALLAMLGTLHTCKSLHRHNDQSSSAVCPLSHQAV